MHSYWKLTNTIITSKWFIKCICQAGRFLFAAGLAGWCWKKLVSTAGLVHLQNANFDNWLLTLSYWEPLSKIPQKTYTWMGKSDTIISFTCISIIVLKTLGKEKFGSYHIRNSMSMGRMCMWRALRGKENGCLAAICLLSCDSVWHSDSWQPLLSLWCNVDLWWCDG